MKEQWKAVDGWPYEISDQGRLRRTWAAKGTYPGREYKPWLGRAGYRRVTLRDAGRSRPALLHTLVAEAFLGPKPFEDAVVNHLDGDKINNTPSNLEWCTRAQNCAHATEHGLVAKGEDHGHAILTEAQVVEIRERVAAGETHREVAEDIGVSVGTVQYAANGVNWPHVGGPITRYSMRGQGHPNAKLTAEIVLELRQRVTDWDGSIWALAKAAAAEIGVSTATVSDAIRGRTWRHL